MFTGIIQETGKIIEKKQNEDGAVFLIRSRTLIEELRIGDSISIDGVCLTVTEKKSESFAVEATPETLRKTNLGHRDVADQVNLEPSARLSDVLGGHLVQGHVDQTGEVVSIVTEGNSRIFRISASDDILRYCTLKGSIAVNGVSLTISKIDRKNLEVTIIPHTLDATNFKELKVGDQVNLEVDLISKYVESHLRRLLGSDLKRLLGKVTGVVILSTALLLGNPFSVGPHTVLVYEHVTKNSDTEFVLRVARYRPDIVLEWDSVSHQGTLHLYRTAVEEAEGFTLTGLFQVGIDLESSDVMSVWLSEKLYGELLKQGETEIKVNRISTTFSLEGEGNYTLLVNKKPVEIPVLYAKDSRNGSWTFHKDQHNPILIEYESPFFRQSLKRVSTAETNKLRWIEKLPTVK